MIDIFSFDNKVRKSTANIKVLSNNNTGNIDIDYNNFNFNFNYNGDDNLLKHFVSYLDSKSKDEINPVTMLFLSLPFLFSNCGEKHLNEMHNCVKTIQTVISKYKGIFYKIMNDDNGTVLLATWMTDYNNNNNNNNININNNKNENDEKDENETELPFTMQERAVMAAIELESSFQDICSKSKLLNDSSIKTREIAMGIAYGATYVGILGNNTKNNNNITRYEYGFLGDKVNLAARLMGLSRKHPQNFGSMSIYVIYTVYICSLLLSTYRLYTSFDINIQSM